MTFCHLCSASAKGLFPGPQRETQTGTEAEIERALAVDAVHRRAVAEIVCRTGFDVNPYSPVETVLRTDMGVYRPLEGVDPDCSAFREDFLPADEVVRDGLSRHAFLHLSSGGSVEAESPEFEEIIAQAERNADIVQSLADCIVAVSRA